MNWINEAALVHIVYRRIITNLFQLKLEGERTGYQGFG